jgi:hypothetical protein
MAGRRIAVIGAGPVGLEAAVYGLQCGFDVTVYDRGGVGASVLKWSFVRLFSPWKMNRSPLGEQLIIEQGGVLADAETFPSGAEYVVGYLEALARIVAERGRLQTHTDVRQIGREGLLKGGARKQAPFRLLLADVDGRESIETADIVIDCAGTYGNPCSLGAAGIPAPGERAAAERGLIGYCIPDVLGADRLRFIGGRTLVVGAGYSAATVLDHFRQLSETNEDTRVLWLTRSDRPEPFALMPDDPLPERDRLSRQGNEIAAGNVRAIEHIGGGWIDRVDADDDGVAVAIATASGTREERVDRILALVGYTPDRTLHQELQVHECYASFAPMKLAAALLSAGGGGGDCLAQGSHGADTLRTPEPNYYVLGAKSYGRGSSFLIKIGLDQVRDVFQLITGDESLDRHAAADRTSANVGEKVSS